MKKIFICAVIFIACSYHSAQAGTSGISTSSVPTQAIKTTAGDVLCVLSNGNKVPCDIVADAEKSIELQGKTVDPNTGKTLCEYNNRIVACDQLNAQGGLKVTSFKEMFINFLLFCIQNKIVIVVPFIIFFIIGLIRYMKIKRVPSSGSIGLFLLISMFTSMIVSQKIALADVPLQNGVECRCVTSASQTCVSGPSSGMFSFWLTDISQPFSSGSFVSSCDTNNTYTTYLWPKTPFMYQGREDKIGNITEGNKYEAMGVGVQANLQATTLGEDTGVACVRAGGVPNMTLKLTGKLTYESQGLCLVGTCTYTTAVTKNFSCY